MAPNRRCRELLVLAIAGSGCGFWPSDGSPANPAPSDPDTAFLHDWKIAGHILGPRALISDDDATELHGRTINLTATGYASLWSGRCDAANRRHQSRSLDDITAKLGIPPDRIAGAGLADPVIEFRLSCGPGGTGRAAPLTFYVTGPHALTCWSGVCYVLVPDRGHGSAGRP